MPRKRRLAKLQEREPPARVLRFGDGTSPPFGGDDHYISQASALKAWPRRRAEIWCGQDRGDVPGAAKAYDGLTFSVLRSYLDALLGEHGWLAVRQALESDREALSRFRARDPKGARSIAPYLEILSADFDAIEALIKAREHDTEPPVYVDRYCELFSHLTLTYGEALEAKRAQSRAAV